MSNPEKQVTKFDHNRIVFKLTLEVGSSIVECNGEGRREEGEKMLGTIGDLAKSLLLTLHPELKVVYHENGKKA